MGGFHWKITEMNSVSMCILYLHVFSIAMFDWRLRLARLVAVYLIGALFGVPIKFRVSASWLRLGTAVSMYCQYVLTGDRSFSLLIVRDLLRNISGWWILAVVCFIDPIEFQF